MLLVRGIMIDARNYFKIMSDELMPTLRLGDFLFCEDKSLFGPWRRRLAILWGNSQIYYCPEMSPTETHVNNVTICFIMRHRRSLSHPLEILGDILSLL